MKYQQAVTDYLEYLELEQNRAQSTIELYDRCLKRLAQFYTETRDNTELKVNQIDKILVRQWRLWLNRRVNLATNENLSRQTQNYHLIVLRNFFKFLAKKDVDCLPADQIELAKVARAQVTFLDIDEIDQLFESVPTESKRGLRDRTILELLFSGGLRVSELVNLNRDQINLDKAEFIVRGKGQKDRPIFISPQASHWLKRYLKSRRDQLPALFINSSAGGQNPNH